MATMPFSRTRLTITTECGLVRTYALHWSSSWITSLSGMVTPFLDKRWEYQWAPIVLLWSQIYFFTVMNVILCCPWQKNNDAHKIDAFNKTSRYLDDILNVDNPYFQNLYKSIYPSQLQLNLASTSDTEAAFLDLNIFIEGGIIITKIYDKRDDFNFNIVNFPFLDSDVPRSPSYGIYMSQLVRYARACSKLKDFHERNLVLTKKLLSQGYLFHKLRKTFTKFYNRNKDMLHKYNTNLKTFLSAGVSHPEFYSDVANKIRKINRKDYFDTLFIKAIRKFLRRGYRSNTLRRTTCMVLDPSTVENYQFLFTCTAT